MEKNLGGSAQCVCGFGNEFFTLEEDEPVCTICGGLVLKDSADFFQPSDDFGKKNILVVDDQAFFRKKLQEVLGGFGHNILEAPDGLEAIKVLFQSLKGRTDLGASIDCLVLDLVMPGDLDGFQTLAVVKILAPDLPVLVLTSSPPTKDLLNQLARLGAKKYLNKGASDIDQLILKNISEI
jgi:CheY-like chemotaxis protein